MNYFFGIIRAGVMRGRGLFSLINIIVRVVIKPLSDRNIEF